MNNFAALDIFYAHTPESTWVFTHTNIPCHLTCYWTDKKPLVHHTSRTIRGKTVPWGTYFCFVAWQAQEQNEPGDTIAHTFTIQPWGFCQTRWFTFRGTVATELSPSVAPIFEHHHPLVTLHSLILRPNAPGDICGQQGAPHHCPDHYLNVNEPIPDDDLSWIRGQDHPIPFWLLNLFHIDPPSETLPIINFIRILYRCQGTISPTGIMVGVKTYGVEFRGPLKALPFAWTVFQESWTENPVTHLPWTWTELQDLQIGLTLGRTAMGLGWAYCTQMYLEVNYWS